MRFWEADCHALRARNDRASDFRSRICNTQLFGWRFLLQSILAYDSMRVILGSNLQCAIFMVRARYGTGVFLKLNKRSCDMRIRLTPIGADLLRVHWRIDGENYYFFASGVMGSQFSAFLSAVNGLYEEKDRAHFVLRKNCENIRYKYPLDREGKRYQAETEVFWDGEGPYYKITFIRNCESFEPILDPDIPDPVQIKIESTRQAAKECTVDGRDLCYAVARACTEALKKYGFKGYTTSTGGYYIGESLNIETLLFIKAYALGAMEARELKEEWRKPKSWRSADSSSFEKEMELLLFDM